MKKINKDHFDGFKNVNDGHRHLNDPTMEDLIVDLQLNQVYSTNEKDTGSVHEPTGKAIFRKLFIIPAQVNGNQIFLPIGSTVVKWLKTGGFINDGANILMLPVPIPNSSNAVVGVAIINSGTTLQIHAGSDGAHDGGEVWIEYTKV